MHWMTPVCSLPWQCVLTVTFHAHDYYVNRLKNQRKEVVIAIHIGSVMRNWWTISVWRALRSGMASKYNNNHLAYWKMISIRRLSKSSTNHCTQQRIGKSRRYKSTPACTLWLYLVNLKTQKREDFKIDYKVRWAWFIEIDDYWDFYERFKSYQKSYVYKWNIRDTNSITYQFYEKNSFYEMILLINNMNITLKNT